MGGNTIIRNVVASCSTDSKIPLSRLAIGLEGTEYEPEQFPGLVMRLTDPKAAALIFNSGKIVCTGTKSPEAAKCAIDKLVQTIQALGVSVGKVRDITIQNIVASANMDAKLNLNKIAVELEGTEYDPEQFPGLIYRLDDPHVVFLLFTSGKVICTGGKSQKELNRSIEKLRENLTGINAI